MGKQEMKFNTHSFWGKNAVFINHTVQIPSWYLTNLFAVLNLLV